MLSIFTKKEESPFYKIGVDIHSHLLPKLDDGVKSFEESLLILERMRKLGYRKVITTPHVIHDAYPNTSEGILEKWMLLRKKIEINQLDIEIEAAAEYQIDDNFIKMLDGNAEFLTFGKKYILVETPFFNEPVYLQSVIFKLNALGFKPILAHPERYVYFQNNPKFLKEISQMNIYFQINMNSLAGFYDKAAQKLAEWMIDHKMVHFLGSDCHNMRHMETTETLTNNKFLKKAIKNGLLNQTL